MSTNEEAAQAIIDAIVRVANTIDPARMSAAGMEQVGRSVNELAEGFAWLSRPSHGS